jgi:ribosomal protein S18 acetylase RimI-like enzyme
MTGPIKIEQAGKQDAESILKLQKESFLQEAEIYNDYQIKPLTVTFEEFLADFGTYSFLKAVLPSGEIAGTVRARLDGNTCSIGRLAVLPRHQNQGIGKLLMNAIGGRFPNAARFELFTGHKSVKNIHLYKKLGYAVTGETKDRNVTLVIMEKPNL